MLPTVTLCAALLHGPVASPLLPSLRAVTRLLEPGYQDLEDGYGTAEDGSVHVGKVEPDFVATDALPVVNVEIIARHSSVAPERDAGNGRRRRPGA